METKQIKVSDPNALQTAGQILKQGGLVAIPTETVYGLAADVWNKTAVTKIFQAKGRPQDNPLIVHICDLVQLERLTRQISSTAKLLMKTFWPGSLTLIFPKSNEVPDVVSAGLDTVAVRFPSNPIAQEVIRAAGTPLAAPSANRSGRPSPTTAQHVWEDLNGRIDAVLDGGACEVGVESTVLDLTVCPPRLLRPGAVTYEQLQELLGQVEIDRAVCHPVEVGGKASSPGMKYKHYAPKARLVLLDGSYEQYCAYVNAHSSPETAALCFSGEESGLQVQTVTYGSIQDDSGQARDLFDALRQLDGQNVSLIYARCPQPTGIGLAVYNRLIRAAGFEVISLA